MAVDITRAPYRQSGNVVRDSSDSVWEIELQFAALVRGSCTLGYI